MPLIDDEGVGMSVCAVRRVSLSEMRIIRREVIVPMRQVFQIVRGPDHESKHRARRAQAGEHEEGRAGINFGADQTRHRIGD